MRGHGILIAALLSLTGCVNYAGMHEHMIPLNDTMLATQYSDGHPAVKATIHRAWWTMFHDATLNQYIETALTDSPTLQIAKTRIDAAMHIADEARASLWPSLDANGQISREHITANTIYPPPFGGNSYTETDVGLNFNYEFDFWGKNRQTLAAKISEARASAADYAESRLVLATAVANQYFQLQYNIAALKIGAAILHQRQAILDIVKVRTTHGVESDIPLSTANANRDAAVTNVAALTEQMKIAQHQLAALLGKNPFTTDMTAARFKYKKALLALPKVLHANVLGCRPDIMASRWRIEAAAERVNAAKARFYPNINLMAILSLQSYTLGKTFYASSRDNSAGVAIDLPIFDAGTRRAYLASQFDEFDIASEQYNQTILTALRDVADQAASLHSLSTQETAQATALHAAEQVYHLTRSRYQHGISDYMSMLEQQDPVLQAQNRELQIQARHLQATVLMIKALGGRDPREG